MLTFAVAQPFQHYNIITTTTIIMEIIMIVRFVKSHKTVALEALAVDNRSCSTCVLCTDIITVHACLKRQVFIQDKVVTKSESTTEFSVDVQGKQFVECSSAHTSQRVDPCKTLVKISETAMHDNETCPLERTSNTGYITTISIRRYSSE